MANGVPLSAAQSTAITGITGGKRPTIGLPTADGEPDIFFVKTPFFSFQFTFDETGKPVFSNNIGYKINSTNFYNSPYYTNSSFQVIDDKGNQYFFGSSNASKETSTITLLGSLCNFPTTWYLDKIVTYNSKDVVTLDYTSFFSSDVVNHYRSSTVIDAFGNTNPENTPITTTYVNPKVIRTIYSQLGQIDFNYNTGRRDDANTPSLSSIMLRPYNPASQLNTDLLKTYNFNYSYFGDPSNDPNALRLKLDNISVVGSSSQTSTPIIVNSFQYNTSVNLPSRQSLSTIDYFGYLTYSPNANPYNLTLPPNLNYTKANVLTSISDISGSTNQIDYELNSYYDATTSNNVDIGGLRVKQISKTLTTGENLNTQYKYLDNTNKSTGQILSNSYMINYLNACGMTKTYSESPSNFYDLNGNYVGYSFVKVLNQNGGYTTYNFSNFLSPDCNDIPMA